MRASVRTHVFGRLARQVAAALGVAFAVLFFSHCNAAAQVTIIVNGDPITAYDIEQRSKLLLLSTHKAPTRQEVIDELIDEKLKLNVMRQYKLEITPDEVETSFGQMAQRMRVTPQQFAQSLTQAGIHVPSFKERMKADMGWQQIIRGKFQADFQFREQDILAAADSQKGDDKDKIGYDYVLRPVLFVVQRGAPPATFEARKREAEALRLRFQSCDESLAFARALTDVAVRDQIIRASADLSPQLRDILANVSIGHLTPPEVTPNGVEMFALCSRKETTADTPNKRQAREGLINDKFQVQTKRYLKELRAHAMIEYK